MSSSLLRLAALFIALLVVLTVFVMLGIPIPGDWALVQWAISLRNEELTRVVWLLTFITSATPALLICAAVSSALFAQQRNAPHLQPLPPSTSSGQAEEGSSVSPPFGRGWGHAIQLIQSVCVVAWPLLAYFGALVSNIALRIAIGRMRPSVDYIPHGLPELQADFQRYSYPSGHAGAAVIAFVALAALAWPHRRLRWPAFIASVLVIAGTGFGRVYLGVHWPSDVVAGYLLAGAWVTMALYAARKLR